MSYFDFYFNTKGDKTLRAYSRPINLCRFDDLAWRTCEADLNYIGDFLNTLRHCRLLSEESEKRLAPRR